VPEVSGISVNVEKKNLKINVKSMKSSDSKRFRSIKKILIRET